MNLIWVIIRVAKVKEKALKYNDRVHEKPNLQGASFVRLSEFEQTHKACICYDGDFPSSRERARERDKDSQRQRGREGEGPDKSKGGKKTSVILKWNFFHHEPNLPM